MTVMGLIGALDMSLRRTSQDTRSIHHRWLAAIPVAGLTMALTIVMLAISLLGPPARPVSAQAAPVAQCNDDVASNVGGQGIACTVNVTNHLVVSSAGTVSVGAPSTATLTRCVGAAGPVAAGAGTCATTTLTPAGAVTAVRQCNGSGNGGGGVVICATTVTNIFTGPALAATPARVYQCIGSVITGPGAPGSCTPVNTAGVTSVAAATVGQCNGSGNGGTSVGFTCTVSAGSTLTAAFLVNVDQCNGSANGGGALTNCSASVTNQFAAPAATPTATATTTPTVTPTPSATMTPGPTPVAAAVPSATGTPSPPSAPAGPTPAVGQPAPPTPADTGNAGPLDGSRAAPLAALMVGVAALALALIGRRMARTAWSPKRD